MLQVGTFYICIYIFVRSDLAFLTVHYARKIWHVKQNAFNIKFLSYER
jgi:hypothetical protein